MDKKYEYFWETEYPFVEFLRRAFGSNFKRKYSLKGNGIHNLIFLNGGIFEIEYKNAKKHIGEKITDKMNIDIYPDCGRLAGETKKDILYTIGSNLKTDEIYVASSEMSFRVGSWLAKIKIVKKVNEPE